jgi:hypothetical protein
MWRPARGRGADDYGLLPRAPAWRANSGSGATFTCQHCCENASRRSHARQGLAIVPRRTIDTVRSIRSADASIVDDVKLPTAATKAIRAYATLRRKAAEDGVDSLGLCASWVIAKDSSRPRPVASSSVATAASTDKQQWMMVARKDFEGSLLSECPVLPEVLPAMLAGRA